MINKFISRNDLERLLEKTQKDQFNFENFMKRFLIEEIVVPSSIEIINGNFDPLLFNKDGIYMMASFTSIDLLEVYKREIKQYLMIVGRQMLEQVPDGIGIVVNPGYEVGFDISPKGIKQILRDFE